MNDKHNTLKNYENRLVAYIDILGFSKLIVKPESKHSVVPWLINILNAIKYNEGIKDQFGEELDVRMEFTAFSDCFVLSSMIPQDPVNTALYRVTLICSLLLKSGLFARGAIVEGQLFHKNNIVFGPGFIEAYNKERKESIYPRIIVSDNLVERYHDEIKVPELDKIINKWSSTLLRKDIDKHYYIDTLFTVPYSLRDTDTKQYLEGIKILIQKELEENKENKHILRKYEWFKNYFNNIINEHQDYHIETIN